MAIEFQYIRYSIRDAKTCMFVFHFDEQEVEFLRQFAENTVTIQK